MDRPLLTDALQDTLTFILAGGQGERLKPLTVRRAKPAVPFGGAYRIIDFTLSNCIHSGLTRVYVLTQYQALSLEEHIRFAWNFLPRRMRQFISARAPHHLDSGRWYAGTADAMLHNIDILKEERPKHVVILSGDHIYRMDYRKMIREHLAHDAKLTIGAVRIPQDESDRFGILEIDDEHRVKSFIEKPANGPEIPGDAGHCLGSMGIYVFETDELIRRLEEDAADPDSSHDFGKNVIPAMIHEGQVYAHMYRDATGKDEPYWRDVGTIDAYYEANLDLCSVDPSLNLYDEQWPVYTLWHNDPPAKIVLHEDDRKSEVINSTLCPGVVVSGGKVANSVISNRVFVDEHASVEDSILLSGVVIGKGARVRRAIIDKWTEVPDGETIGYDLERDRERFTVTDSGIVVVPRATPIDF